MNQKNVFMVIGVILVLQGIAFYFMAVNVISDAFPSLDEAGKFAPSIMLEVLGAFSLSLGLVAYASRNTPAVLWAWCIGTAFILLVSLKHLMVDHINVPVFALVLQVGIMLVSGYLWMRSNTAKQP